ncbi:MAG: UDP-glucose/GDP-mannose dehydrogenase family protein [Deltaproteobacteria bacterium]|nr:MAG: UDP-glucose/GDP-mannose dehydrogenase family protein [Deltaproteobacteria bacterium]
MNICVIGTGYVGLVAGTCFAESGNDVTCVDINEEKIRRLSSGEIPIYEPGLEELVRRNLEEGRLRFDTNLEKAVKESFLIFIAVGTPADKDNSADVKSVLEVASEIGKAMNGYKIVILKSTVPVGTAEKVREVISNATNHKYDVISNPEFLKEGAAVEDFMRPDRVIIGGNEEKATKIIEELYSPFLRTGKPIIIMDNRSAELTKYAANAMLATRISFINELANLCEQVGADIGSVRAGLSSDSRIGTQFLFPGAGYGGSCFPKDLQALIQTAAERGIELKILPAVEEVNRQQKMKLAEKINRHFQGGIAGKVFAVWGLSFKPRTDDMREAPSIVIINELLDKGARVKAHDPEAIEEAKKIFGDKIEYYKTPYDALAGADALVLITEWAEFRRPNFERIRELLKKPVIFDGRNIYDPKRMKEMGYEYYSIGR